MDTREVVVVGAGPVGALTALGLAQRGHEVLLLEANPDVVAAPRAIVYYWHVLDGLDRLGLLDDIDASGFRNTAFRQRVLRTGLEAVIPLEPIRAVTSRPWNVHLGQDEVVRIALAHLARNPGVQVEFGARVTAARTDETGAVLTVDSDGGERLVRGQWVVAADGARSTVRGALGIGFEGVTWPDRFVATDIRFPFAELGGLGNANMLLDPTDGCVIARIDQSGRWRWTWGEPADLPESTVAERLPGRLAALGFGAAPYELLAVTPYRMHQRMADRMRQDRVLLIGDAAHATNPTGGLGLTSGLYDLFALVDPLSAVLKGEDTRVLDRWAEERATIFRVHASPMASRSKHLVYDEKDFSTLESAVRTAADQSDPTAVLNRLTGMTVLRTSLPRHHAELL